VSFIVKCRQFLGAWGQHCAVNVHVIILSVTESHPLSELCYENNRSHFLRGLVWSLHWQSLHVSRYFYVTVLYHYCATSEWVSFHFITFNLSGENCNPHPIYMKRLVSRLCTSVPHFSLLFCLYNFTPHTLPYSSRCQIFVSGWMIINWTELNSAEAAVICPNLFSLYLCLAIDGKFLQDSSH
jgi:hypothetical protein